MGAEFTILVNSTDSFEDCWQPFFKLFSEYWPNCDYDIVLNTETKDFSYPGLNIRCSKVGANSKAVRPRWGWCLSQCLDQITTEAVLYLQEDYFLEGKVDVDLIRELAVYMVSPNPTHQTCAHIGLTHFGSHGPFSVTEHPLLWEIGANARYRLSLQAGLWKTEALKSFLRDEDTGWSFEEQGPARSRRTSDRLLTVNRQEFNQSRQIFPYTHTGIIRGKWNRAAVESLFSEHDIRVDYSLRGFYEPPVPVQKIPSRGLMKRIIGSFEWRRDCCVRRTNDWLDRIRSI